MHVILRRGAILFTTVALLIALAASGVSCREGTKPAAFRHPAIPVTQPYAESDDPPPAPREFRAAWVATVGNIDWPTKPGLSTAEQQAEILRILDRAQELHLNAIILQVRTTCDALYDSKLEPWSYFLTGEQGKPPEPYYDPLKFWIDQAHSRGIELHAWFNPFRTRYGGGKYAAAANHVTKGDPELCKDYGKVGWMDPGEPAAQDHSFNVFMDVVERYDVDGIHIDDYFYPYPERANPDSKTDLSELPFPDDASYGRYVQGGGKLNRADWRRQNINTLIKRIYDGIKQRKKDVRFGISPFGIPRPREKGIEYVTGFDQYDKLYADTVLWLKNGWCDYFVPQLYWRIGSTSQPYLGLLEWWTENNPKHRQIYGGLFTSKLDWSENTWHPDEILGQIEITRLTDGAGGNVHFSMVALNQNRRKLGDQLRDGLYGFPALVPASTWLDSTPPATPKDLVADRVPGDTTKPIKAASAGAAIEPASKPSTRRAATKPFLPLATQPTVDKSLPSVRVTWKPGSKEPVWLWAVSYKQGKTWRFKVVPGDQNEVLIRDDKHAGPVTRVAVAAVDRCGNESKAANVATGLSK